jgi:hypothetical protein
VKKRSQWWLGACALATGMSSWGTAAASTPAPSASQLMSLAIHNAESAGWVHEVSNATRPGHTFSMVNDIGATQGRQVVVSDGAHARVLVLNGNAYLYGDNKAIANYFGLSTTDPQKYANQWLELKPSNSDYSTVSAAVTLASDFSHVSLPGSLREGRIVTIKGHKVRPISAHIAATSQTPASTATLYITTSGRILPFEYRAVAKGFTSITSWSNWGNRVTLIAPTPTLVGS